MTYRTTDEFNAFSNELKEVIKSFAARTNNQDFLNENIFLDFVDECEKGTF